MGGRGRGGARLAGAGGAYGFDDITREAKKLERAARSSNAVEAEAALALLKLACDAAAQAQVEGSLDQWSIGCQGASFCRCMHIWLLTPRHKDTKSTKTTTTT